VGRHLQRYQSTERSTADETTPARRDGLGEALGIVGQGLAVKRLDPIGRAKERQRGTLVPEQPAVVGHSR
jgi:hypothetical protein